MVTKKRIAELRGLVATWDGHESDADWLALCDLAEAVIVGLEDGSLAALHELIVDPASVKVSGGLVERISYDEGQVGHVEYERARAWLRSLLSTLGEAAPQEKGGTK